MKNYLKKTGVGLAALLCAGLCSLTGCAGGAEKGAAVYHSETGYTAEKITHPEKGVKEIDGIVDYDGERRRWERVSGRATAGRIIPGAPSGTEIICISAPATERG